MPFHDGGHDEDQGGVYGTKPVSDTGSVFLARERSRRLATDRPIDPALTLSSLQRGPADPTYRLGPDGAVWRGIRTPEGPATVRIAAEAGDGVIGARAWGPGGEWVLDRLPGMVGAEDDIEGFRPGLSLLERIVRRYAGWRVCRTGLVFEALVPAILEQQVTATEAWRSWRELVWRFGERAPGPVAPGSRSVSGWETEARTPVSKTSASARGWRPSLWVPPDAATLATLPVWEWHRAGVAPRRARTVVRAARVAARLEETIDLAPVEAERRLRSLPGIGVWTAAEVLQRAHGHPDAVSVGDDNLPKLVGHVLAGRPYDDRAMLAALERWRGHRYRVTRLIELAAYGGMVRRAPRRAPRFAPRDYRGI